MNTLFTAHSLRSFEAQSTRRKPSIHRCPALGRLLQCRAGDPARFESSRESGGKEESLCVLCGLSAAGGEKVVEGDEVRG